MLELEIPISASIEKLAQKMQEADSLVGEHLDSMEGRADSFGQDFLGGLSDVRTLGGDLIKWLNQSSSAQKTFGSHTEQSAKVVHTWTTIADHAAAQLSSYNDTLSTTVRGLASFASQGRGFLDYIEQSDTSVLKLFKTLGMGARIATGFAGAITVAAVAVYRDLDGTAAHIMKQTNQVIRYLNQNETMKGFIKGTREGIAVLSNALETGVDYIHSLMYRGGKVSTTKFRDGLVEDLKDINKDFVNGLPEISFSDVRESKLWKSIEWVGDRFKNAWLKLTGPSYGEVLSEMSVTFQKSIKQDGTPLEQLDQRISIAQEQAKNSYLAGDIKRARELRSELDGLIAKRNALDDFLKPATQKTLLEQITEQAKVAEEQVKERFLAGDMVGYAEKMEELQALKDRLKEVTEAATMIKVDVSGDVPEVPAARFAESRLSLGIDMPADNVKKIAALREALKSVQSPEMYDKIVSEIEKLESAAEKMARTLPAHWQNVAKGTKSALGSLQSYISDFGKQFKQAFASFAAQKITNIFSQADKRRLKDLNDELREQRKLMSDKSVDRETRAAAKARIELIQQEMEAEKARGNVLLQTAGFALDAAKQYIQAKLAEALAAALAGEAPKGLVGLVTAGLAVAGFTALFASKVPQLADGASMYGPSIVQVAEYPNAQLNPEYIRPADKMQKDIQQAMRVVYAEQDGGFAAPQEADPGANYMPSVSVAVQVSGEMTSRTSARDLYYLVKLQHAEEKRITGRNPLA